LGIRTEGKGEYPKNMPYFILKDAPDVAKVYGETPDELDVQFFSTDLEMIAPHYYMFYKGGYKDAEGNTTGGELQCKGDGVIAQHRAKQDPITRIVPQRQCLAESCPDWCDAKGNQQCKPSLKLFFILPRVHPINIYQMDTTSANNIRSLLGVLRTRVMASPEWFMRTVFKLGKVERPTSYFNKNGEKKQTKNIFLELTPYEEFRKDYALELESQQKNFEQLLGPSRMRTQIAVLNHNEAVEGPMEDNFPTNQLEAPPQVDPMITLADLPELNPLFQELCDLKKKVNDQNVRLGTTKKFQSSPDPKAALVAYLKQQIDTEKKKAAPATPPPAAPAEQKSAIPTGGLI